MTETIISALHKHAFTEDLSPRDIEKLTAHAKHVRFEQGQTIFHQDDECSDFYLIVSGRVALEVEAPDHLLRVQTLGAGDELGWSAVLMGRRKHFQACALEPVEALAMDGVELLAACRADTAFGFAFMYRMLGVVSERLQGTRLQLLDMHSPVAKRAGT
jgi:CRP/FNR family cyclic AMP-dependent transcriptional regulator